MAFVLVRSVRVCYQESAVPRPSKAICRPSSFFIAFHAVSSSTPLTPSSRAPSKVRRARIPKWVIRRPCVARVVGYVACWRNFDPCLTQRGARVVAFCASLCFLTRASVRGNPVAYPRNVLFTAGRRGLLSRSGTVRGGAMVESRPRRGSISWV